MDTRNLISTLLLSAFILITVFSFVSVLPVFSFNSSEYQSHGRHTAGGVTMIVEALFESRAGNSEIVLGILEYIPPPDITICFCGEYLLRGEDGFKSLYIVSDSNDLSPYVGKKILVMGKAFTGWCTGTLLRPCNYFSADKIVEVRSTGTTVLTWGMIKSMYN